MTLVLSLATPAYLLHVSDRLVSRTGVPHDRLAHKTVVLRGTDGLLVFGCTGLAFVDGVPTDTWIADVLSGRSCLGQDGALRLGTFPVRDVGWSLLTLCRRVRAERLADAQGRVSIS
jgi:hypothetical protein